MSRATFAEGLRASDVVRLNGSNGRRVVVFQKTVESDSVKVFWRGIVKKSGETKQVSASDEGVTFLSRRILHPVEGVWEGELTPGSLGRVVFYNNRRYEPPKDAPKETERKGSSMPAKSKSKTAPKGRGRAAAKPATRERATDAQLDKLAAQVVKLRDTQGKPWGDICDTLDIEPSRARQLYNRGGGSAVGSRASSGGKKTPAKTAAKTDRKKRRPS